MCRNWRNLSRSLIHNDVHFMEEMSRKSEQIKMFQTPVRQHDIIIFIDREAGEIIHLVVSVCMSVCLFVCLSVCLSELSCLNSIEDS